MFKYFFVTITERKADKIWFMGSSIVFWASQRSKRDTKRWTVLTAQEGEWHGERGMGWSRFRPKLDTLLQKAPPPQWLCVLLGSNDLGSKPLHELISCAQINLNYVATVSPDTKIIWSDILPRTQYRGAPSNARMEVARKSYNKKMRRFVKDMGGKCIKHPGIQWNNPEIFRRDGVHMNDLGNDVLNAGFQDALVQFQCDKDMKEYPIA